MSEVKISTLSLILRKTRTLLRLVGLPAVLVSMLACVLLALPWLQDRTWPALAAGGMLALGLALTQRRAHDRTAELDRRIAALEQAGSGSSADLLARLDRLDQMSARTEDGLQRLGADLSQISAGGAGGAGSLDVAYRLGQSTETALRRLGTRLERVTAVVAENSTDLEAVSYGLHRIEPRLAALERQAGGGSAPEPAAPPRRKRGSAPAADTSVVSLSAVRARTGLSPKPAPEKARATKQPPRPPRRKQPAKDE